MSIVRFVADVHIGNHKQFGGELKVGVNDRARRILSTLRDARANCHHFVVLGDLFDTSSPSPQLVRATMDALAVNHLGGHKGKTCLLLGNHDMFSADEGDNALVPLHRVAYIHDSPEVHVLADNLTLLAVPFRPEPMSEWFAETVGSLAADATRSSQQPMIPDAVLCFHGGVRDHNTPKYLWSAPDAIDVDVLFTVMQRAGIRLAVCGNWHNARTWKRDNMTVVQVGALVPTGFDNAGWEYGGVLDFDTVKGKLKHDFTPVAPRFLTLTTRGVQDAADRIRLHPGGVYIKVKLAHGETQESVADLLKEYDLTDHVLGLAFESFEADTAQQEMEAAEAARTADTLDGAVREYVEAMPLADGVDRASVQTKVLSYLSRD